MNITTGNINSLITWFEKDHNTYKFLCLVVAGHLNDSKFFTEVFDNQEALDTISGKDVAIFLFANEQTEALEVEVRGGEGKALPGRILLPQNNRHGIWYKHISDLPKEKIRDDVIKASQNISTDICHFFRLDIKDIPCIVLLGKGDPSPFVIPTKGEAEVKEFYNLLKELRVLASTLPAIYDLDWSFKVAKPLLEEEKVASEKMSLSEAETELQSSLTQLYATLEKYGLPHSVCEQLFNLQTAEKIWETIGLRHDLPQPPLAVEFSEIFKKALEDGDLKDRARDVIRSARNVADVKKRLIASEKRIEELKSIKAKLDITLANFQTARDAINKLSEKFEKKFIWKSRYRPIKQFAETFLGVSKKANELLSLQESIKKLIVP